MKKIFNNIGIKGLSVLLSIMMVLTIFPLSVFAELPGSSPEEDAPTAYIKEPFELLELREENAKYFQQTNGTTMVAVYEQPVHYADENGVWQDIDNTLAASGSEYATKNARVKFAKKVTGNETLFTLHEHNRKITVSLVGARKKTVGTVVENSDTYGEEETRLQKMMTLENLNSTIIYEEILEGVDLEYTLNSHNIKENIIVKEKQKTYSYDFIIKLNGLAAAQSVTGEIVLSDEKTGERAYVIPRGYMWDANGEVSQQVSYTLTSHGNGIYTLCVSADSTWINDESRAFPVKIDPTITSEHSASVLNLQISQSSPTVNYNDSSPNYVTKGGWIYWKMNTLPHISADAKIVSAEFAATSKDLLLPNGQSYYNVALYEVTTDWDETLTFNKRKATSYPQGVLADTWEEYHIVTATDRVYRYTATSIVQKWYNGQNYGLCLGPQSTTSNGGASFASSTAPVASQQPLLTIVYEEIKGLEDYWSYATQDAGFAGSGAINYATGHLTFAIPTLTTTDALFGYTPTLYYNTSLAGLYLESYSAPTPRTTPMEPIGFQWGMNETLMKMGDCYLWLDGDGTAHDFYPETTGGNTYTDEDGLMLTLKFAPDAITITDSAHNARTFEVYGTNAYYLSSFTDSNGNKVIFEVDSNKRPISIQVKPYNYSAITQLRIYYNAGGLPYLVLNPTSGEGLVLRYSYYTSGYDNEYSQYAGYLRQVVRAHGSTDPAVWNTFYTSNSNTTTALTVDAIANYAYDNSGRLTQVTNNLSQYRLSYIYDAQRRVTAVEEFAGADYTAVGQKIGFEYLTFTTVARTSGADDVYGNDDDILSTHNYDSGGRVVNTYSSNTAQTDFYGAASVAYVGDNDAAKNSIKSGVVSSQLTSNLLKNGGFEKNTTDWTKSGSANYVSSPVYDGQWAMELVGNASVSQPVSLRKGSYTLSFYVHTDVGEVTNQASTEGYMLYVKVYSSQSGSYKVMERLPLNEYNATDGFSMAAVSFEATPLAVDGTESFTISVEMAGGANHTVVIDNVMLAKAIGAADFDMMTNGHFEQGISGWEYDSASESGVPYFCSYSSPLRGNTLCAKYELSEGVIEQVVYYAEGETNNNEEGMLLVLSGWGYSLDAAMGNTATFGLELEVTYYNPAGIEAGDTGYQAPDVLTLPFDRDVSDWQLISGSLVTNPEKGSVTKITVRILYKGHPVAGFFDNISLVKDTSAASAYTYNANGKLDTSRNGKEYSRYEYDSNGNVTRVVNSDYTIVDYTYDAFSYTASRVTRETHSTFTKKFYDPQNVQYVYHQQYVYNVCGQLTDSYFCTNTAETTSAMGTHSRYNMASGSHIFGVLTQSYESGVPSTYYFYDQYNGRLLAVIDPEGNGVCYTYDGMGNLTNVHEADAVLNTSGVTTGYVQSMDTNDASVAYSYDVANRLSQIVTGSSTYVFSYDNFGNSTAVSVNDARTLAAYTYNPHNGKINTMTYGNGLQIKYVYDAIDRISEIQYNVGENGAFETVYTYTYDAGGRLFSVTDESANEVTVYQYDLQGNLLHSVVYGKEEYVSLYQTRLEYDEKMHLSSMYTTFGYADTTGQKIHQLNQSYTYDLKNRLVVLNLADNYNRLNGKFDYHYDEYGRMSGRDTLLYDGEAYSFQREEDFTFYTEGDTSSYRVASYSSVVWSTSNKATIYQYTYDDNGNITHIKDGENALLCRYTYDTMGQLTREDNAVLGKTYVYTYDVGGNIVSKSTYAYTTGSLGIAEQSKTYTYGDTTWGDLLTNWNGYAITYDTIGNPLQWKGATLTWQGRQLQSYTKTGKALSFTYNADGIRTSKTVNGVEHEYILNGSQIIAERWGGNVLRYLYNESGAPIGFGYRNSTYREGFFDYYFYDINLQGDIVGLYNESWQCIGTYTYDAWGYCTITATSGISATDANVLTNINPFRYRGYYYDVETGLYYVSSRYYDPEIGRWINADGQLTTGSDLTGLNLFAYCGNNPVNRIDPTGEAWWHWALGAAVVAVAAVATVVTCGGFAAAATAVCMVGSGVAAATTASTIAAGAFIGSATVYGMAVLSAASTSSSVQEFNDQGNWGTVAATAFGGLTGGYDGYTMSKAQATQTVADDDTFLPDSFYSKHAPKQSIPNSSYTNYTYNNYTGKYEKSTAYYDFAGRQNIRIDWTNHGYSNHGNPHVHYTTYNSQYRDGFTIRWD